MQFVKICGRPLKRLYNKNKDFIVLYIETIPRMELRKFLKRNNHSPTT